MRRFILGLLTLLAVASLADAGGLLFCRRCRRCHAVNVPCAVAVAAEVVAAPVAEFVPIQIPTYSVTYTPIVQQITRQETYTTVPVATQVKTTVQEQTYGPPATVLFQANGQQVQGVSQVTQNYQAQQSAAVSGYAQQAVPQSSAPLDQPVDRIEAAMMDYLKMRRQLAQSQKTLAECLSGQPFPSGPTPGPVGTPPPPPAPGTAPQPQTSGPQAALSIFNKSCAACHDAKVSATNGKGFTLLADGKIAPLNDKQLGQILTKTYTQEMPKQPNKIGIQPLTDQEVGTIIAWVKEQQK